METHSSILAWRIPWTGKPGGLQSVGSHTSQTQLKRLCTHAHSGMADLVSPGASDESSSSEDEKGSEITLQLEDMLLAKSRRVSEYFPTSIAEDILGAAFGKKAFMGQHFPTEGFPPACGRSYKDETKQVEEGLVVREGPGRRTDAMTQANLKGTGSRKLASTLVRNKEPSGKGPCGNGSWGQ